MQTCTECGATLAPDIEWCGQCYAPITKASADEEAERTDDQGEREPWVVEPPRYSAWKAGPYSFGPVGRLVITGIMVLLGVVVYFAGRAVGKFYGIPGLGLVLMFLGIYTVIAIIVLWGVWRPTRIR